MMAVSHNCDFLSHNYDLLYPNFDFNVIITIYQSKILFFLWWKWASVIMRFKTVSKKIGKWVSKDLE